MHIDTFSLCQGFHPIHAIILKRSLFDASVKNSARKDDHPVQKFLDQTKPGQFQNQRTDKVCQKSLLDPDELFQTWVRCARMARGNQRDQAREKAAKANKVLLLKFPGFININYFLQLNLVFVKKIDLCTE